MVKKHKWKNIKNKSSLKTLNQRIEGFSKVSLKELNQKAGLLDRKEQKYLVPLKDLIVILGKLHSKFDILDINGISTFSYHNIYFDDDNHTYYKQHRDDVNGRIKIRTRSYKDSGLFFFEFKRKYNGVMRKERYKITKENHGVLDEIATRFIEKRYSKIKQETPRGLKPLIITKYKRITLVHKGGKERITLDLELRFKKHGEEKEIIMPPIAIMELKTNKLHGKTQKKIERNDVKKISGCSKYCLAHHYLGTEKDESFHDVIKIFDNK